LAPVGPTGEIIMDYSVHDAIKAGFNKIVFIIRKDIEKDFREIIGSRIEKICGKLGVEVAYAFQAIDALPQGQTVPEGRTKPWGTGQAVLAAKDVISEPFAVLNADDYYGKEAFVKIHDYLVNYTPDKPMDFCMAGFILKNTLSENGGVTRGICKVDENGNLTEVVETTDIEKTADGAAVNGAAVDADSHVSMNMWGLTPEFLDVLEDGFVDFFKEKVPQNPLKAEYLIPIFIGELLEAGKVNVKMLETHDTWFGVTYAQDKPVVIESFKKLIENGEYNADLYSDLL
ncbi:MAG: sugar phosphate nucleotidyltransferase, partial [Candidatus Ornithomonoglobus sp.]